ncbi:hypothetical protein DPF_0506 [Desulfoplanes formicivorans]|uniref:Uncharacterized protein n=1 Tax=Desulfoplanes formicivorans TaxID=1592317 RepID=A0A194ACE6_9BACT|nr:hypothetical protein DPF_0506 [Desulfoplanes formicivorans]
MTLSPYLFGLWKFPDRGEGCRPWLGGNIDPWDVAPLPAQEKGKALGKVWSKRRMIQVKNPGDAPIAMAVLSGPQGCFEASASLRVLGIRPWATWWLLPESGVHKRWYGQQERLIFETRKVPDIKTR